MAKYNLILENGIKKVADFNSSTYVVYAVSNININTSGFGLMDGVLVPDGGLCLLTEQTDTSENGVWRAYWNSAWIKLDEDINYCTVSNGNTYSNTIWRRSNYNGNQIWYLSLTSQTLLVAAVATSPITFSGLQTIDDVQLSAGDLVLAINQTLNVNNGVLVVSETAWSRYTDSLPRIVVSAGGTVNMSRFFIRYSNLAFNGINSQYWLELPNSAYSGSYNDLSNKPDLSLYALISSLASVATSGDYADLTNKPDLSLYALISSLAAVATSGDYTDLINKPDLSLYALISSLAAVATSGDYTDLINKPDLSLYALISSLAVVATSGDYADLINKPDLSLYALISSLAAVATSGSYNDLTNKPDLSLYALISSLAAVATSGSYTDLLNKPDLSLYALISSLAAVATSGSYNDLINKPDTLPSGATGNMIFHNGTIWTIAPNITNTTDNIFIVRDVSTSSKNVSITGNHGIDVSDVSDSLNEKIVSITPDNGFYSNLNTVTNSKINGNYIQSLALNASGKYKNLFVADSGHILSIDNDRAEMTSPVQINGTTLLPVISFNPTFSGGVNSEYTNAHSYKVKFKLFIQFGATGGQGGIKFSLTAKNGTTNVSFRSPSEFSVRPVGVQTYIDDNINLLANYNSEVTIASMDNFDTRQAIFEGEAFIVATTTANLLFSIEMAQNTALTEYSVLGGSYIEIKIHNTI